MEQKYIFLLEKQMHVMPRLLELSEKYSAECVSIPGDGSTVEGIEKLVEELTAYEPKIRFFSK